MKPAVPLSRYLVFFALAVVVCAADLASKSWMFDPRHLGLPDPGRDIWWIWPRIFGFQTSLNEGALFGLGQGFWIVFSTLSVVAVLGIIGWLFLVGAARSWILTVSLGFVTAGILGNLYDRLGLPGFVWPPGHPHHPPGTTVHAVRDFIVMFQVGDWHWPNYNIADSALVCGAALLVWHSFTAGNKVEKAES